MARKPARKVLQSGGRRGPRRNSAPYSGKQGVQGTVVGLRLKGLGPKEIAKTLGIPVGSVYRELSSFKFSCSNPETQRLLSLSPVKKSLKEAHRLNRVFDLRVRGLSPEQIAKRLKVSCPTVLRDLLALQSDVVKLKTRQRPPLGSAESASNGKSTADRVLAGLKASRPEIAELLEQRRPRAPPATEAEYARLRKKRRAALGMANRVSAAIARLEERADALEKSGRIAEQNKLAPIIAELAAQRAGLKREADSLGELLRPR